MASSIRPEIVSGGLVRVMLLAVSTFTPLAEAIASSVPPFFQLVEALGRLGLEPGGDLVVAPLRLDLAFHLVERALARRRDAGDVVPDIAAVGFQRIVVDADVGREGCVD